MRVSILNSVLMMSIIRSMGSAEICKPGEYQCRNRNCESEFASIRCPSDVLSLDCIWGPWLCDNKMDCEDGSDEYPECVPTKDDCNAASFRCANGDCIWDRMLCNGVKDCSDSSDETNCKPLDNCNASSYRCDNGDCIWNTLVCNGVRDCSDSSDETNCWPLLEVCHETMFMCANLKCISHNLRCNGQDDCGDQSDELPTKCGSAKHCKPGEYQCRNRNCESEFTSIRCPSDVSSLDCIWGPWLCDNKIDCEDGSDEYPECVPTKDKCNASSFRCASGDCIWDRLVCNGVNDCSDSSDETNCAPMPARCDAANFTCANGKCISASLHCNIQNDCGDFSDEHPTQCEVCSFLSGFICGDGSCIAYGAVCDGNKDCPDGTDEASCYSAPACFPELSKCNVQCPHTSEDEQTFCIFKRENSKICSTETSCNASSSFQCYDCTCIDRSAVCNGSNECTDADDEVGCDVDAGTECSVTEFRCSTERLECIKATQRCDGVQDCGDGSDEVCDNYCKDCLKECEYGYRCRDYSCINYTTFCDNKSDCVDSYDESKCQTDIPCFPGEYRCTGVSVCIPGNYACNGIVDCGDASDESYQTCGKTACQRLCTYGFQCEDCRCINYTAFCDGNTDCADGADEPTCKSPLFCATEEHLCRIPRYCIPQNYTCNGIIDCRDGSDEAYEICGRRACSSGEWLCANGWQCIRSEWVCDGHLHCDEFSDEVTGQCGACTEFECNNHLCIPFTSVCDGIKHCHDGSDEGIHCEDTTKKSTTDGYSTGASYTVSTIRRLLVVAYCVAHCITHTGIELYSNC